MPIDTSMFNVRPLEPHSPLETYGRALQLKSLIQRQQAGDLELQEKQLALDEQKKWDQAFIDARGDLDQLPVRAAQLGVRPQTVVSFQQMLAQHRKAMTEADSSDLKLEAEKHDIARGQIHAVLDLPEEARAQSWPAMRAQGIQRGLFHESELPEQYPGQAMAQSLMNSFARESARAKEINDQKNAAANQQRAQAATDQANLAQQRFDAQLPGIQAETEGKQLTLAAQTVQPIANQDQYDQWRATLPEQIRSKVPVMFSQAAVEIVRRMGISPGQAEQLDKTKEPVPGRDVPFSPEVEAQKRRIATSRQSQGANAVPEIQPNTPQFRVAQDLAYGRMTFSQFRTIFAYSRNAGEKQAIYNKAAELNPNFNPASFEMGFQLARNPKVQQQLASLDNVVEGVPDLLRISDQATRSGVTALNKVIVPGGVAIGGKKYSNFRTAQIAFADELSGALGYGSATDMSREMGFNMTDPNLSPENFRSGLEQVVVPFVQRKRSTLLNQMGIYGQPGMNPAAGTGATPQQTGGGVPQVGQTFNGETVRKVTRVK